MDTPVKPSEPARPAATTPDSLVDQAFEKEMALITEYREKYPSLDTASMMAAALDNRKKRKDEAFQAKMQWSLEANKPQQAAGVDVEEEMSVLASSGKRRRSSRSPAKSRCNLSKASCGSLTESFVAKIEQHVRSSKTRHALCQILSC